MFSLISGEDYDELFKQNAEVSETFFVNDLWILKFFE